MINPLIQLATRLAELGIKALPGKTETKAKILLTLAQRRAQASGAARNYSSKRTEHIMRQRRIVEDFLANDKSTKH